MGNLSNKTSLILTNLLILCAFYCDCKEGNRRPFSVRNTNINQVYNDEINAIDTKMNRIHYKENEFIDKKLNKMFNEENYDVNKYNNIKKIQSVGNDIIKNKFTNIFTKDSDPNLLKTLSKNNDAKPFDYIGVDNGYRMKSHEYNAVMPKYSENKNNEISDQLYKENELDLHDKSHHKITESKDNYDKLHIVDHYYHNKDIDKVFYTSSGKENDEEWRKIQEDQPTTHKKDDHATSSEKYSVLYKYADIDAVDKIEQYVTDLTAKQFYTPSVPESEHVLGTARETCKNFKEQENLEPEKINAVWEIAYYRSKHIVKCFKMYIKPVTKEKQETYKRHFGNLNGVVFWDKCMLEVTSIGYKAEKMYHFLQGWPNGKGVLQNIIFTVKDYEYHNQTRMVITLLDRSTNQWMILDNLLLMRECRNGDIIIFTKVPYEPKPIDIKYALIQFTEDADIGTWACEKQPDPTYRHNKYNTIS